MHRLGTGAGSAALRALRVLRVHVPESRVTRGGDGQPTTKKFLQCKEMKNQERVKKRLKSLVKI